MGIKPTGRTGSQPPLPETTSIRALSLQVAALVTGYPEKFWRGQFDNYNGQTVEFQPQDLGKGKAFAKHLFERDSGSRIITLQDTWIMNLSATGIDMGLAVAGIIDGIAFEANRNYLVWALLDASFQWAGMGITRKPYSAFTAISTGSAPLNSTRNFTVVNAYQFTVGSRVVVRNQVGTAPLYEWNWGVVQDPIINSTTLTIKMDNNSNYGVSITGTTSGEILQWNMFRPWIVTPTEQTLYLPYHSLVGEIFTDGSGNIQWAFRADDEWRLTENNDVHSTSGAPATTSFSLGRYLPLWADMGYFYLLIDSATPGNGLTINGIRNGFDVITQVANQTATESNIMNLNVNAGITVSEGGTATSRRVNLQTYKVFGGMRG